LWGQEKGYRDYGHDMDNTDTILECGLGFTCDFEKPDGFIGQEFVLAQRERSRQHGGLSKRMASVLVPGLATPLLHHGEILWRNGNERVSEIRSASYGHTLGGPVGLTMLESHDTHHAITKEFVHGGHWEIEIAEQRYPCQVSLIPFHDPKNIRIKG
jgi:4-methylaminobutanoate oxidase (formaldehyde-forming)